MNSIPHLLEWVKYKRLTVPNIGNYVDQLRTLIHCWWEYKMIQPSKNSLAVFYKDKHTITHTFTQAFTYLPREIKMYVHKDSYRKVGNITALLIIVPKWKQSKWFPSTGNWISCSMQWNTTQQ